MAILIKGKYPSRRKVVFDKGISRYLYKDLSLFKSENLETQTEATVLPVEGVLPKSLAMEGHGSTSLKSMYSAPSYSPTQSGTHQMSTINKNSIIPSSPVYLLLGYNPLYLPLNFIVVNHGINKVVQTNMGIQAIAPKNTALQESMKNSMKVPNMSTGNVFSVPGGIIYGNEASLKILQDNGNFSEQKFYNDKITQKLKAYKEMKLKDSPIGQNWDYGIRQSLSPYNSYGNYGTIDKKYNSICIRHGCHGEICVCSPQEAPLNLSTKSYNHNPGCNYTSGYVFHESNNNGSTISTHSLCPAVNRFAEEIDAPEQNVSPGSMYVAENHSLNCCLVAKSIEDIESSSLEEINKLLRHQQSCLAPGCLEKCKTLLAAFDHLSICHRKCPVYQTIVKIVGMHSKRCRVINCGVELCRFVKHELHLSGISILTVQLFKERQKLEENFRMCEEMGIHNGSLQCNHLQQSMALDYSISAMSPGKPHRSWEFASYSTALPIGTTENTPSPVGVR